MLSNVKSQGSRYWTGSGRGAIIVSTTDCDAPFRLAELRIELEGLEVDDGANLSGQLDQRIEYSQKARQVCDEQGILPLALCQMGSYIRHTQYNINDFLGVFRE
jgi:hypothetical protein